MTPPSLPPRPSLLFLPLLPASRNTHIFPPSDCLHSIPITDTEAVPLQIQHDDDAQRSLFPGLGSKSITVPRRFAHTYPTRTLHVPPTWLYTYTHRRWLKTNNRPTRWYVAQNPRGTHTGRASNAPRSIGPFPHCPRPAPRHPGTLPHHHRTSSRLSRDRRRRRQTAGSR